MTLAVALAAGASATLLAITPAATAATAPSEPGAAAQFLEYYAATDAQTNGALTALSTDYGQLSAEAVYRRAVTLSTAGQYVEFTLSRPANAVDLRYSIPDSANGAGQSSPLSVYLAGEKAQTLSLTSRYSWQYGAASSDNPTAGQPHHFYDDVRASFVRTLPVGTKVRFQLPAGAATTTIDLADFYRVALPSLLGPRGALNAWSFGADPTGRRDSTHALQNAINAGQAQHRTVFVPVGKYLVNGHLSVDNVTLTGAGQWWTTLTGNGVGVYGKSAPAASSNVRLSGFSVIGQETSHSSGADRSAFGGALANSTITDVFVQHTGSGMSFVGPFSGLSVSQVIVEDVMAGGITLRSGIADSTVTNNFVRNTGDDGIALVSGPAANHDDIISSNTVLLPIQGSDIALYGGADDSVVDNIVGDTVIEGAGIEVSSRSDTTPLSGLTTISRNTLLSTGSFSLLRRYGIGALWFYAPDKPFAGTITVDNNTILDSPWEAIQFLGTSVSQVNIGQTIVRDVGPFVIQNQAALGSVTVSHVDATGTVAVAAIYDCLNGATITQGPGNIGLGTRYCGNPAPSGALKASPTYGNFGLVNPGQSSGPQDFTITNPGPRAATFTSITVSAGYSRTTDCPATLAAGASCVVRVTFTPDSSGPHPGTLTFGTDAPNPPSISLTGIGASNDPNPNLLLGRWVTAPSAADGHSPGLTNDGNQSTYFESDGGMGGVYVGSYVLNTDLATPTSISRIVLKLPTSFSARTQTIAVLSSNGDRNNLVTTVPATPYLFDPVNANTVTITFPATTMDNLRLVFSSNDVAPQAQLGEFEVYAH